VTAFAARWRSRLDATARTPDARPDSSERDVLARPYSRRKRRSARWRDRTRIRPPTPRPRRRRRNRRRRKRTGREIDLRTRWRAGPRWRRGVTRTGARGAWSAMKSWSRSARGRTVRCARRRARGAGDPSEGEV